MRLAFAGVLSRIRMAWAREAAPYGAAAALCALLLTGVLELWRADLSVPFAYHGDAVFTGTALQGMIRDGWYTRNNRVGMPQGMDLGDYPSSDFLHFLVMKILSLFTDNYAVVMNVYFLLGFPLAALASLFVLRRFGLGRGPALAASVLFAFAPYHFLRGEGHLLLASYYGVPLITMAVLGVFAGEKMVWFRNTQGRLRVSLSVGRTRMALGIAAVAATSGIYYAFFGCFFLALAGTLRSLARRDFRPLLTAATLAGLIFAGIMLQFVPGLVHRQRNGENPEVARRIPMESELYGMKVAQLLLPVSEHRLPFFAGLKSHYNATMPLVTENDWASLGLTASAGFALLLLCLLLRGVGAVGDYLLSHLGILNLAAVLLGSVGGFGTLFALAVSPQIRAYNRISIFIQFFCLFGLFRALDAFMKARSPGKAGSALYRLALAGVVLLGTADQTTRAFIPPYDDLRRIHSSYATFVRQIEGQLPADAMIFQFPYVPFPENPPVYRMIDYDHFRVSLHAQTSRWSYGAVRGRWGDAWQRATASMPLPELVDTLVLAGFQGICMDRFGYPDNGSGIEADLAALLGVLPEVDDTGRLAFFALSSRIKALREMLGVEWDRRRREALRVPVAVAWREGFSGPESGPHGRWRWCSDKGEMVLENLSSADREIRIEMSISTGYSEASRLRLESTFFMDELSVSSAGRHYSRALRLPPGRHRVVFRCDAPRVAAPDDPRHLVFAVWNFSLTEEP